MNNNKTNTTVSNILKTHRIQKKLTQQEIAELLEIPQQRYSEWETGKVIPGTINTFKLIEILEIDFKLIQYAIKNNKKE